MIAEGESLVADDLPGLVALAGDQERIARLQRRDAGKRPLRGAIAAENADGVIVTDDNPRSEKPEAIRAAILAAAKGATEIGDRAKAISSAIADLQPGDALLVAGKGHETGQIIGDKTLPFSDHEAVASALTSRVA